MIEAKKTANQQTRARSATGKLTSRWLNLFPIESLAGCYQAYYQNVAAVLASQAGLAVKPEEALNTIRIIEFAMQSAEQRRTITVPSA